MANKKVSRRALFTSVISLILCCAMLMGTTFAWFTDSVTSGLNTINSGNLDVELMAGDKKVDANTKLFDNVVLWEPGMVVYENLSSLKLLHRKTAAMMMSFLPICLMHRAAKPAVRKFLLFSLPNLPSRTSRQTLCCWPRLLMCIMPMSPARF